MPPNRSNRSPAPNPSSTDSPDGRRRRGNATRESILQAAADLASVEGSKA